MRVPGIVFLVITVMVAVPERATANSLLQESPFLPPGFGSEARTAGSEERMIDRLQFTGLTQIGDALYFSVLNPDTGRGHWIGLHESQGGIAIVSYDEARDTVVVTVDGDSRQIRLRDARVTSQVENRPGRSSSANASPLPAQRRDGERMAREERAEAIQALRNELMQRRAARGAVLRQQDAERQEAQRGGGGE